MGAAKKLVAVPVDSDGEVDGGIPALIPAGVYQLKFECWDTVLMFGRSPKVVITWSVCDFGEHFGTKLKRWYNATRIIGKPGRSGRFKAGWSSDLFREFVTIAGMPQRSDRIPLSRYASMIVLGEVQTVVQDRQQEKIPTMLQYSVIRKLLRKEN